ncbi:CDP-alcohol phosphatidyltransferase family protein [Nocardioides sp. Bht2]|uniref:CDP-alcohol phosphatidyltransferase family protein n=1 Tax=Nocardioides sp. Bht2 TaxID=3392297 RepID=UPI0039B57B82
MTTTGTAPPRMIWARLAVDPVAEPLARKLAVRSWITPNRITVLALALATGAAACFASGQLRVGGALFLARYFFDCVDGMVARRQGTGSARGAALDISADVLGLHLVAAALCWYLVREEGLAIAGALALLAILGVHNWALSHRKYLAAAAGAGDGGSDHALTSRVPVLRSWLAWCRKINMAAFPWVLEVEIAVFGLLPLVLPARWLPVVVVAGAVGYVLVVAVNLRRIARLAAELDQRRALRGEVGRHVRDAA